MATRTSAVPQVGGDCWSLSELRQRCLYPERLAIHDGKRNGIRLWTRDAVAGGRGDLDAALPDDASAAKFSCCRGSSASLQTVGESEDQSHTGNRFSKLVGDV